MRAKRAEKMSFWNLKKSTAIPPSHIVHDKAIAFKFGHTAMQENVFQKGRLEVPYPQSGYMYFTISFICFQLAFVHFLNSGFLVFHILSLI